MFIFLSQVSRLRAILFKPGAVSDGASGSFVRDFPAASHDLGCGGV